MWVAGGGLRGALAAAGVGSHGFYIGAVAPPFALRARMGARQHCPASRGAGKVVRREGGRLGGPVVVACGSNTRHHYNQDLINW